MDSNLKLINKWLVIFTVIFLVILTINKLTCWRYIVKDDIVIDTITNDVLHVTEDGKVSRVR